MYRFKLYYCRCRCERSIEQYWTVTHIIVGRVCVGTPKALTHTPGGNLLGTASTGASTYDDVIVELDLATGQVVAVLACVCSFVCVEPGFTRLGAQVIHFMNTSSIGNTGITAQAIAFA